MTSPTPARCAIVVHGGAGNKKAHEDGCIAAVQAGRIYLASHALDAAVAAVQSLEDDGRFNAGRGASLRLDGRANAASSSRTKDVFQRLWNYATPWVDAMKAHGCGTVVGLIGVTRFEAAAASNREMPFAVEETACDLNPSAEGGP